MTGLNLRLLAWRACLVPASLGGFVSTVLADEASNVRLVGYHDLQGRQALQVTTRSDSSWIIQSAVPEQAPVAAGGQGSCVVFSWNVLCLLICV